LPFSSFFSFAHRAPRRFLRWPPPRRAILDRRSGKWRRSKRPAGPLCPPDPAFPLKMESTGLAALRPGAAKAEPGSRIDLFSPPGWHALFPCPSTITSAGFWARAPRLQTRKSSPGFFSSGELGAPRFVSPRAFRPGGAPPLRPPPSPPPAKNQKGHCLIFPGGTPARMFHAAGPPRAPARTQTWAGGPCFCLASPRLGRCNVARSFPAPPRIAKSQESAFLVGI